MDTVKLCWGKKCGMFVWLHGRAGRGPKMDVVANQNKDETERVVKKSTHIIYKTIQPELFTPLRSVTVRSAYNTGASMTWFGRRLRHTDVGVELHRSEEKKRGKHGSFRQQEAWCCCWCLQNDKHHGKTGESLKTQVGCKRSMPTV